MSTNSAVAAVKAAHSAKSSAQAVLEKIEAAISAKTRPPLDKSSVELAQRELEDCLARRILGEASASDESNARAELVAVTNSFEESRKQQDSAALEFEGLSRRLQAAQVAESGAHQALIDAEEAWILEELRVADEAYTKLAVEIERQYARVFMCVGALNLRGVKHANPASNSGDLLIPTIGAASVSALMEKNPTLAHGVGQFLFQYDNVRYSRYVVNEVDRELAEMTESKPASGLQRLANLVASIAK